MLSPQLLRQSTSRSARYVAGRVRVSTLWSWRLLAAPADNGAVNAFGYPLAKRGRENLPAVPKNIFNAFKDPNEL